MTNSDRLQEIRERAEKYEGCADPRCSSPKHKTAADRIYLLQLVTEQQNEISWLRTWIFRLDPHAESAAKKILEAITEEPMTIEQVKGFLGIDPGSAFGTPATAD